MTISWIRLSLLVFMLATNLMSAKCAENAKRITVVDAKQKLLLAQNGKSNTVIVIPEKSCKVIRFAGEELQKFMQQALNDKVPIVSIPDKRKTSIILGDNSYSRKVGIKTDKLPRGGFIIKSVNRNIFIVGKDNKHVKPERSLKDGAWAQLFERGTLFGVYDFLERFVGVRFYFPGEIGTVVPEYKNFKVPTMNIVERPDYQSRKISWYWGQWYEGTNRDKFVHPGKNLNYYRLRMETCYIPNNHGLGRAGYLRRFGKTHPEYFVKDNGEIIQEREIFTWNQEEESEQKNVTSNMHMFNDDFGGAMLQTASDLFNDEKYRKGAYRYAQWLVEHQDEDGGFCNGTHPSAVPTALMYFHDLGQYYNDEKLLNAREKTLNKLFDMQFKNTGDIKLDGGIAGRYEGPENYPGGGNVCVNNRVSAYALSALIKLESDVGDVWLGRNNKIFVDPLKECVRTKKFHDLKW